eukprot:COSAG01_NODE_342_length_18601_cov_43.546319_21_plen_128_part_00
MSKMSKATKATKKGAKAAKASTAATHSPPTAAAATAPPSQRQNATGQQFERRLRDRHKRLASMLPVAHVNDLTVQLLCDTYAGPELSVLCGFQTLRKKAKPLLAERLLELLVGTPTSRVKDKLGTAP